MKKIVNIGLLALVLGTAACGIATGPQYKPSMIKAPPANAAQLIIYRPHEYATQGNSSIQVNGAEICTLKNGEFMSITVDPGEVVISAAGPLGSIGESTTAINSKSGGRYYVKMLNDKSKYFGGMASGILGSMVQEGLSENKGPFVLKPVGHNEAQNDLIDTKQSTDCK